MKEIDVESIMESIRDDIQHQKEEGEQLLNFIASQLAKAEIEIDDEILESVLDDVKLKHFTTEELKSSLKNKISSLKEKNLKSNSFASIDAAIVSNLKNLPADISKEFTESLNKNLGRLDRNKDLSDLQDSVMHFSQGHQGFLKRIFNLQISQNYLSALKFFILNDLTTRQTVFNQSTQDSIKNILNLINTSFRENGIIINELKNYQNDSTNWIRDNDVKLNALDKKLNELEISKLTEIEKKLIEREELSINALEKKLTEKEEYSLNIINDKIKNLMDSINKTDRNFTTLLESTTKLNNIESKLSTKIDQNIITVNESYNELKELVRNNVIPKIDKNMSITNDRDKNLQIKVNENYNELKEMIINRDLKTTEFLLNKISNLKKKIPGKKSIKKHKLKSNSKKRKQTVKKKIKSKKTKTKTKRRR